MVILGFVYLKNSQNLGMGWLFFYVAKLKQQLEKQRYL